MKLPKKLKILGRDYTVRYCDLTKECDTQSLGYICHHKLKIMIDNHRIGTQRQESTLLHELIHSVCDINDVELTEHQINLLEAGLYQILTDNGFLRER
jgi:Zn-dependent peptidase ImmA (M78 family)